jgi:hypothetical protein
MRTMVANSMAVPAQPVRTSWSKKRQLITVVPIIALILAGVLGLAALTGTVLYTSHEDLRYAPSTFLAGSWYAPSLNNSRGERTASIEVLFPSGVLQQNVTIPMMVSVWHTETTHLDSLDLTLSTAPGSALWVWLNPSSGGNPMQITNYGSRVVITFPSLSGVYGSGSVVYDLLVQPIPYPKYSSYPLNLDGQITLHDNNYLFVQHTYSAEVMTQLQIAPNGTITGQF